MSQATWKLRDAQTMRDLIEQAHHAKPNIVVVDDGEGGLTVVAISCPIEGCNANAPYDHKTKKNSLFDLQDLQRHIIKKHGGHEAFCGLTVTKELVLKTCKKEKVDEVDLSLILEGREPRAECFVPRPGPRTPTIPNAAEGTAITNHAANALVVPDLTIEAAVSRSKTNHWLVAIFLVVVLLLLCYYLLPDE